MKPIRTTAVLLDLNFFADVISWPHSHILPYFLFSSNKSVINEVKAFIRLSGSALPLFLVVKVISDSFDEPQAAGV